MSLMRMLEYRADFFFWTVVNIMWTLFSLLFFSLLVNVQGNIGGWSRSEMLLLLGVFSIFQACMWMFMYGNMGDFVNAIYDGSLNLQLLKPVDAQFFIMTNHNSLSNISRLILGFAMIAVASRELGLTLTLANVGGMLMLLFISFLLLYFIWFTLACLGFHVERLRNINDILPSFDTIWRVPNSVFSGATYLILTTLIPLALLTTVPAEMLLGVVNWTNIAVLFVSTVIFGVFSRQFFKYSIKKYSGMAN